MTASSHDFEALWQAVGLRLEEVSTRLLRLQPVAPGCTDSEVVWQKDTVVLRRYLPSPSVKPASCGPLLICYALVNRPEILDLQPDRSLVARLLAEGLEVYLIDWGRPDDTDQDLQLADYIDGYLHAAVRYLLRKRRLPSINLLGVCQGGTLALCYCALHPKQVAHLVTMVTPVDFHTPCDLLAKWARHLNMEALRNSGNLPGAMLTGLFLSLRPFRLMHQKYVGLLDQIGDDAALETFSRMERWIYDSPDQAAATLAQFVGWLYQENRLVRGTLRLNGRRVDLHRIRQPVLNIYAEQDHIVPPAASMALRAYLGDGDYTELPVDTGHIGMYVSRASQVKVASAIASWLRGHR